MQCEAARERLVDGLTSPEEMAEVERHLAECAACRAESASLTHLWETLGAIDSDGPFDAAQGRPDAAATTRMRGRLDALLASRSNWTESTTRRGRRLLA